MNLYQELLDCLEEESHALISAREEAILAAVAKKGELVNRLLGIKQDQEKGLRAAATGLARARLEGLQRQVVQANARNREIVAASLELIQEFWARFRPDPGLYCPAGPAKPIQEWVLFQRRA